MNRNHTNKEPLHKENSLKNRPATIKDVAELAGVTHTTVSRAINHPEMVRPDTLSRIMEACEALKYQPNLYARGMRTDSSYTAALIVPAVADPSYARLAQGVQDTLADAGIQLMIASSDHSPERELSLCRNISNHRLDGIIIANSVNDPAPTECFSKEARLVLVARYVETRAFDGIYLNVDDGVHQLVSHLYTLGHRRIALITGPDSNLESRQRVYALTEELGKLGLSLPDSYICSTGWTAADGRQAAQKLLALPEPPTAILALNDTLAGGAIGAAADLGLRVPQDISIAGFYNEPGSESAYIPLTTVDTGYYEIGCSAAELLLARMKDPDAEYACIIKPLQLITRRSTGPAPFVNKA